MANNVTNALTASILSTEDSTNNVLVNRSTAPFLDEHVQIFVAYAQTPDTLSHNLVIPGGLTVATHVYLRNLAASGGGSLLVSLFPNGGANVQVCLLGPQDVLIYWQGSTGAGAVGGITQGIFQISLVGSAIGVPYEYFLGA